MKKASPPEAQGDRRLINFALSLLVHCALDDGITEVETMTALGRCFAARRRERKQAELTKRQTPAQVVSLAEWKGGGAR